MRDVFISYAREDEGFARKLYRDLREKGVAPWLDSEDLLGGSKWELEVPRALRESKYALILLSGKSVTKRGYFQKEIKVAVELLERMPEGEIFIVPARIEECKPPHSLLEALQWVDLFPSYGKGIFKILEILRQDSDIGERLEAARKENHKTWVAAELHHRTGELAGEDEWTASVPSRDDYLVYGQYISLAPGKYESIYRLKVKDIAGPSPNDCVAHIDISSNTGNRTISKKAVMRSEFFGSGAYQDFKLSFEVDSFEDNVEMRVFYTNKAQLTVATIEYREVG